MSAKCPHCNQVVTKLTIVSLPAGAAYSGFEWNAIAYACPLVSCQKIISVQIDPIALKADTVNEIIQRAR